MQQLLTILIGISGGIAVGIQSPIATAIGRRVGPAASSMVVHASGLVFSIITLLMYRGENIQNWRAISWWMYGTGIMGVILYLGINHTIPRIGATSALTLIIIGQLIAGVLIDQFGWFGVELRSLDPARIIGILLLICGGYLIVR